MQLEVDEHGSKSCPDDPGEPSTHARRISVTEDEEWLLTFLARGRTVVEIGTGLGVSTRALMRSARMVYTNDCDPWVWENVHRELTGNVWCGYHRGTYNDVIDMVFIDANHNTEYVIEDVAYARRICTRGMIVAHDAHQESVKKALDETFHTIPTHYGIAISYVGWSQCSV